jgi:hypothetical protein
VYISACLTYMHVPPLSVCLYVYLLFSVSVVSRRSIVSGISASDRITEHSVTSRSIGSGMPFVASVGQSHSHSHRCRRRQLKERPCRHRLGG